MRQRKYVYLVWAAMSDGTRTVVAAYSSAKHASAHAAGAMRPDEDGYAPGKFLGITHMYITVMEVSPL